MRTDVAAVVVAHNSEQAIARCLASLSGVAEIVVVDNASADSTCRVVERTSPRARLIRNTHNRGFAAAVNQGISATSSPLVLLLNPDAELRGTPNAIDGLEAMVAQCLRPMVAAAGGKLLGEDGSPQRGFNVRSFPTPAALTAEVLLINRLWPRNPINRRYRMLDWDPHQARGVDQPAGAFLMIRRDVLEAVGLMDERFFPLWFDDVDLCLRIRQAGYKIRYTPGCEAVHRGGHSIQSMALEARQRAWYGNLLRFTYKHFSPLSQIWLWGVVFAGLFFRWTATFLGGDHRGDRKAYIEAMRFVRKVSPPWWGDLGTRVGRSSSVQY